MIDPSGKLEGDSDVLRALADWLAAGDRGALVTVLRTWGSSPRPPGSLLAIRRRDGRMAGSVSGGCVEADLVERYVDGQLAACPTRIDYGVDPASAARHGLPCGGRLELLIEEPPAGSLLAALDAVHDGRVVERRVDLRNGAVEVQAARDQIDFAYAGDLVRKQFGPRWHLLLIGAGQIADCLSRMALMLGFEVTVCDPRDGYDTQVGQVTLSRAMPDDAVAGMHVQARSAVVTLAHDPRLDDLALLEALNGDFFYVGALGSRRTSASRLERLRTLDIDGQRLARLHAPVGVDIGSRTPAEIAVAIAAQLVAARHGIDVRA